MPNIDLGTFAFDTAAVQKNLDDTKKKMFELKQEQSEYREESKDLNNQLKNLAKAQEVVARVSGKQSEQYKDLEKQVTSVNKKKEDLFNKELKTREALSKVNKEYRDTTKVMASFKDEEGKLVDSMAAVDNALQSEVKSIAQARESNKELLNIRNQLDLSTEEGVVAMEKLNDKLNENNQFIKESVSGYEQQKINIGNYEGAVEGALGPLGEFLSMSEAAGGVMPLVAGGLQSAKTALVGFTKSAIAFIATPVGVVLGVIAGAFLLVRNALNRSEESTNKLRKAFAPLSGMFNKVLSALEPLGEFLIDGLVEGLEMAEEGFYSMMDTLSTALNFLGFEDAAKSVNSFKQEIKDTSDAARDLAQAEADLEEAQRKQTLTMLQFQKEAEEFRQIRDDESKTIAERIQANEDLGRVLDQQLQSELALAETALRVANLRIEQEGRTSEALDAQAEALTEIADIEERIAGQRSEQLTNRNSLEKEALDLVKERQEAAIKASEEELNLFIAQQGFRKKSAQEQLNIAKTVRDQELKILEDKLKYKQVSELEYQAELLNIRNEYLELQRDLVIENAEQEREAVLAEIEKRKTDYAAFTEDRLEFEIQNSQDILEQQRAFAEVQLEQGAITEQEYQAELQRIRDEARVREDEARLTWEEANKERQLIDAENQRLIDEEKFINEFELRAARLEQQRLQEIEAAEKTGASITLINEKYAQMQTEIEEEKQKAKVQMTVDTLGAMASILGEQSKIGKAFALTQALINTYQGITAGVKLGWPAMIPAVAAATATGFGAVRNITQTKAARGYVSDGKGTLLKGARHSGGGIQIEAEDGEPILTRKAFQMFPDLISEINVAGGGIPLAARGMVAGKASNNSVVQNKIFQQFDMRELSETISEGVKQGAMEGSATGAMQGSQQGITNLSDNREIQRQSAF